VELVFFTADTIIPVNQPTVSQHQWECFDHISAFVQLLYFLHLWVMFQKHAYTKQQISKQL